MLYADGFKIETFVVTQDTVPVVDRVLRWKALWGSRHLFALQKEISQRLGRDRVIAKAQFDVAYAHMSLCRHLSRGEVFAARHVLVSFVAIALALRLLQLGRAYDTVASYKRVVRDGLVGDDVVREIDSASAMLGGDAAQLVFQERYATRMFDSTVLFDGVAACLKGLDRLRLSWGIVTNKGQRYSEPLIRHLGLSPAVLVCGDMVEHPKPAADSLLLAASALGLAAADCVYVGDDGKDVVAARTAGMRSIAALYGYSSRLGDLDLEAADCQVHDVAGLTQLVWALAAERQTAD